MTYDTRIDAVNNISFAPDTAVKTVKTADETFDSIFSAVLEVIDETNRYQLVAEQSQTDLATGKTNDMLTVLRAQDRAYSSLNFTVQVTNKIIESYREIMRMQL